MLAFVLADFVNGHDVRVIQSACRDRFSPKAPNL